MAHPESPAVHDRVAESHGDQAHAIHAVPMSILVGTLVVLLVLTFLTVAATWIDLGPLNVWLALGIAVLKAGVVALFFMHLYWDKLFNGIVLIASLFFVALFMGIAILDSREYQPVLAVPPAPAGMNVTE